MINSVVLMGRLTYEPELKSSQSGISVIRFQMAVDRNYQPQGQIILLTVTVIRANP